VAGLVTDLDLMAEHAVLSYSYTKPAGLSLQHGPSSWPSIYLITSSHSVVILVLASCTLTDVHCCHRLAYPITRIFFCPNGRFLVCFTSGSILTVLSISFETKVLDFDTYEGSSSRCRGLLCRGGHPGVERALVEEDAGGDQIRGALLPPGGEGKRRAAPARGRAGGN